MNRVSTFRQSAMHSGGVGLLQAFIYLLIALVSFYGDGVFVWMNVGHYTGQYAAVFQVFLILGAFCTSASIMCLLWGKARWFRPGTQLWIAYIFTAVEVIVNVLNIVIALNPNLGIIELWRIFSPATPFVALIGWIFILQTDKAQRERHAQLEMEEQQNDSEREYQLMVHEANMDLKFGYLEQTKQRLHAALNSPQAQRIVEQHAQNLTAQVLNEITGLPVMPQLPAPQQTKVQPVQLSQTAHQDEDSYPEWEQWLASLPPDRGTLPDGLLARIEHIRNEKKRTDVPPSTGQWHVPPNTNPLASAPIPPQNGANSSNGNHQ